MNLFGIGFLELAVIFLVTFLAMGPVKSIEMARTAGKLIGELRKTMGEMNLTADLNGSGSKVSPEPTDPPSPIVPPQPPSEPRLSTPPQAVPTTGSGEGNERQP